MRNYIVFVTDKKQICFSLYFETPHDALDAIIRAKQLGFKARMRAANSTGVFYA